MGVAANINAQTTAAGRNHFGIRRSYCSSFHVLTSPFVFEVRFNFELRSAAFAFLVLGSGFCVPGSGFWVLGSTDRTPRTLNAETPNRTMNTNPEAGTGKREQFKVRFKFTSVPS